TSVRTASGGAVRLSDIATISSGSERSSIGHEGGQRRQVVTANVTGGDVSGFVAAAKARIARTVHSPPGVFSSWAGAAEGQAKAAHQSGSHVSFTAVAMVISSVVAFGGSRPASLISAGMPSAMAGGVSAVASTGGVISSGSSVGFITLFGISARNAISSVAHVDELVARDGSPWTMETVSRATRARVTPIVSTASVTAFASAPSAWESGQSGREVQGPMALVISGGLATSSVSSSSLLPASIWRWR
ncbi:hypothetical protein OY671_008400, partial [Metschnikowia pulcherrima]